MLNLNPPGSPKVGLTDHPVDAENISTPDNNNIEFGPNGQYRGRFVIFRPEISKKIIIIIYFI